MGYRFFLPQRYINSCFISSFVQRCRYSALQKNSFFRPFMKQNGVYSNWNKVSWNCCQDLDLLAPSKGVIRLSIEVVYDLLEQGAAKLQSLKVCSVRDSNPGRPKSKDSLCNSRIIFDRQLWRPITLLLINIESLIVPHLKDLIRIYLELEDQDPSRNLKMTYALPNNPYFTS